MASCLSPVSAPPQSLLLSAPIPRYLTLPASCLPLHPSLSCSPFSHPFTSSAPNSPSLSISAPFILSPPPSESLPILSLPHLSPPTRLCFGSHCVTFTRPFSAAVSTETSSWAREGGTENRPTFFPLCGDLSSLSGGWGGTFSADTLGQPQTFEDGLMDVCTHTYAHDCNVANHPCLGTHHQHTAPRHHRTEQFTVLPSPSPIWFLSFCVFPGVSASPDSRISLHLSPGLCRSLLLS